MPLPLIWMASTLRDAGLKVAEVPGWQTRGRPTAFGPVRGVMCHHTAGGRNGNMPSLNVVRDGRSNLPGPLSQLGLGRDGTVYVIAAGRANHAGPGRWNGHSSGNTNFIGIEAENTGLSNDNPWPDRQYEAYVRCVAALLTHEGLDANDCCGHKEYATPAGRKIDPTFDLSNHDHKDMDDFRAAVRAVMNGTAAPLVQIPAVDGQDRPTLRRGARGEFVVTVQKAVSVNADGIFGTRTEAAVRAFQRGHALVPDGIVGPLTWAAIAQA